MATSVRYQAITPVGFFTNTHNPENGMSCSEYHYYHQLSLISADRRERPVCFVIQAVFSAAAAAVEPSGGEFGEKYDQQTHVHMPGHDNKIINHWSDEWR